MRTLVAVLLATTFLMTPVMEAKTRKARAPHAKRAKVHRARKQKQRTRGTL